MNTLDRQSPLTGILLIMSTFLLAALISAFGRAQSGSQVTQPIYVLTTPLPTMPLPTADTRLADENARLRARVAELEAEKSNSSRASLKDGIITKEPIYLSQNMIDTQPTPQGPGYTAQTDQGPVFVPDSATPVPAQGYTGPFLVPQLTPVPENVVRYCTGFHDWRDYDGAYAASPACKKP